LNLVLLFLGSNLLLVYACAQEGKAKKLIYYGWGIRDTQYVREIGKREGEESY
jgi:hypothetical protein